MTPLRTGRAAALTLAALMIAGCTATPVDTSTAPSPGPDSIVEAPEPVDQPGEEICVIQRDWEAIDALLITAARENPPAPTYTDAMYRIQAVFPPDSIEDDWLDLRTRVEAYVPIITAGDPAELAQQTDEVTAIAEAQLRLFSYFQTLCP